MSNNKHKKNNKKIVKNNNTETSKEKNDILLTIDELVEEDETNVIDYEMDIEDEEFEDYGDFEEDEDLEDDSVEIISEEKDHEESDEEPSLSRFIGKKDDIYKYNIERYNDNYSSAIIFGVFAGIEIIIVILSFCKVFGMFQTTIQKIFLIFIAAAFSYMTFYSYKEAKKYKKGITKEEKRIETVRKYFDEVVTEEYLKQFDDGDSVEENYLKRIEGVKNEIIQEHPDWNIGFIERVIDDYFEG